MKEDLFEKFLRENKKNIKKNFQLSNVAKKQIFD